MARTVEHTTDVDGMLASMPQTTFQEWWNLYSIDPWGEERADLNAGIIACASVSPHVKKGTSVRPVDFMPDYDGTRKERPKQSIEEMKSQFARAQVLFGKKKA